MTPEWREAACSGDVETLGSLLEHGVDVDALDRYGQTALMLAALSGHAEAVKLLVAHGADLDHTAKYRLSALMLAVVNGRIEIVRELVAAGANLDLRGSGAPGFEGKTARDLAEGQKRKDLVEALDADL